MFKSYIWLISLFLLSSCLGDGFIPAGDENSTSQTGTNDIDDGGPITNTDDDGFGGINSGSEVGTITGDVINGGLIFKTSSGVSGVISNGKFNFNTGDQIKFLIGKFEVSRVTATPQMSLLDLFGSPQPTETDLRFYGSTTYQGDNMAAKRRFLNGVVLLYSLDDDQDPSNGIDISAETLAKFNQTTIDLDFTAPSLGSQLSRVFLETKIYKSVFSRLTSFYYLKRSGIINASSYCRSNAFFVTGTSTPSNSDTKVTNWRNEIHTWDFTNGKRNTRTVYTDKDDKQTYLNIVNYNKNGGMEFRRTERVENGNTKSEVWDNLQWDNNRSKHKIDYTLNGSLKKYELKNTYDSLGRTLSSIKDYLNDSFPAYYVSTSQYNPNNKAYETSQEEDTDFDGVKDRFYEVRHNANGYREYYRSENKTSIRVHSYKYSNLNQVIEDHREYINKGDSTSNSTSQYTFEYDANGNKTRSEQKFITGNATGSVTTYQYDSRNLRIASNTTRGENGPTTNYIYTYDIHGQDLITKYTHTYFDQNGTTTTSRETQNTYYSHGNKKNTTSIDQDGNEILQNEYEYKPCDQDNK